MSRLEHEFTLDGHTYRAGRISTMDQLKVASQWRDVMLGLALAKKDRPPAVTDEEFRGAMNVVVSGGLGRYADQCREEVTRILLSVVSRQQKGPDNGIGWAPISAPDGSMMFEDIGLRQWIPMFYKVADHNGILDFFSDGLSKSAGGPKATG